MIHDLRPTIGYRPLIILYCPCRDPSHIPPMRITTWTEYSLIIALHLARRGAAGAGPVAAREIAEVERLPGDYVEQILLAAAPGGPG